MHPLLPWQCERPFPSHRIDETVFADPTSSILVRFQKLVTLTLIRGEILFPPKSAERRSDSGELIGYYALARVALLKNPETSPRLAWFAQRMAVLSRRARLYAERHLSSSRRFSSRDCTSGDSGGRDCGVV